MRGREGIAYPPFKADFLHFFGSSGGYELRGGGVEGSGWKNDTRWSHLVSPPPPSSKGLYNYAEEMDEAGGEAQLDEDGDGRNDQKPLFLVGGSHVCSCVLLAIVLWWPKRKKS